MSENDRIQRLTDSPLFPFAIGSAGNFVVKPMAIPMNAELTRDGEDGKPCHSCNAPDRVLWTNGRWKICALSPTINPVGVFLETVEHVDFGHLDEAMAAEFGVLTWKLERAIGSLESVGRVHIHRWGDGSSHFHVWFVGRPARQLELYGWGNVLWPQLLEPLPTDELAANHEQVLARFR
jgi:hypothetical protein